MSTSISIMYKLNELLRPRGKVDYEWDGNQATLEVPAGVLHPTFSYIYTAEIKPGKYFAVKFFAMDWEEGNMQQKRIDIGRSAMGIFTYLMKFINSIKQNLHPKGFIFIASDRNPARFRLYAASSKRIASEWGGRVEVGVAEGKPMWKVHLP